MKTTIPNLSIILATDCIGGFGKAGKIPWESSEDLAYFKKITKNSICIMGRKTYENMLDMIISRKIKNNPNKTKKQLLKKIHQILPDRECFVLTSDSNYKAQGATVSQSLRSVVNSLEELDNRPIFVIGGQQLFQETLAYCGTIFLTIIKGDSYECDRFFPIGVINKYYKLVAGTETEDLYFTTFKRLY